MGHHCVSYVKQKNILLSGSFTLLLLCCMTAKLSCCFSSVPSSLNGMHVQGNLSFDGNEFAARDFGNRFHFLPLAVLHPKEVSDIAAVIKHVWKMGPASGLSVAARGHGHSLQGQAQAPQGIVINMESLSLQEMQVHQGQFPYVDVSAGELWINVLHKCLFHGVLGGLGQFGVISQARISLEPAPKMVKWIRVLYSDFSTFARDQELLISAQSTFDYIEGIVIKNKSNLINNWRSSFKPDNPVQAGQFISDGRILFCLELTKNFNPDEVAKTDKEIKSLLSQLSYISSTLFITEASYVEFLDRVHRAEVNLRSKGLWDLPHPWLNLLVPKSKIQRFSEEAFGNILKDTNNGPVIVYPMNKSKWNNKTSFVTPQEDIFYMVAFLHHAVPSSTEDDGLQYLLSLNKRILAYCEAEHLGVKQYLPHYTTKEEWQAHFGPQWEAFAQRKSAYDPLAILAVGQRIFQKGISSL